MVVTTEQAGRAAVDSLKKLGVDFIEVYSWLSSQVYFATADEAQKQGMSFVGHVPKSVTPVEASNAGQKSFEHLYEILLAYSTSEAQLRHQRQERSTLKPGAPEWLEKWTAYNQLLLSTYSEEKAKELFALFVKNSTWQCPTLIERYASANFIESSQAHPDRLKYLSTPIKEFWSERTDFRKKNFNPASIELLKKQYQK